MGIWDRCCDEVMVWGWNPGATSEVASGECCYAMMRAATL